MPFLSVHEVSLHQFTTLQSIFLSSNRNLLAASFSHGCSKNLAYLLASKEEDFPEEEPPGFSPEEEPPGFSPEEEPPGFSPEEEPPVLSPEKEPPDEEPPREEYEEEASLFLPSSR